MHTGDDTTRIDLMRKAKTPYSLVNACHIPQDGWIHVDTELPEEGTICLLADENGACSYGFREENMFIFCLSGSGVPIEAWQYLKRPVFFIPFDGTS